MNEQMNTLVPYVVEKTGNGERSYDIFSRLLKDRIVFIDGEINGRPCCSTDSIPRIRKY